MLELSALFTSNWDLDRDDGQTTGGDTIDGNTDRLFEEDNRHDPHGHEQEGRRRWGEEALYWLERAVSVVFLFGALNIERNDGN